LKKKSFLADVDRRKVDPYPAEQMAGSKLPKNTICAVLRDIYAQSQDENIKELARVATTMAKKMSAKLYEYHKKEVG
jgi:hypothetical protein